MSTAANTSKPRARIRLIDGKLFWGKRCVGHVDEDGNNVYTSEFEQQLAPRHRTSPSKAKRTSSTENDLANKVGRQNRLIAILIGAVVFGTVLVIALLASRRRGLDMSFRPSLTP